MKRIGEEIYKKSDEAQIEETRLREHRNEDVIRRRPSRERVSNNLENMVNQFYDNPQPSARESYNDQGLLSYRIVGMEIILGRVDLRESVERYNSLHETEIRQLRTIFHETENACIQNHSINMQYILGSPRGIDNLFEHATDLATRTIQNEIARRVEEEFPRRIVSDEVAIDGVQINYSDIGEDRVIARSDDTASVEQDTENTDTIPQPEEEEESEDFL